MTLNNTKTGLFRPWDEVRCASDVSHDDDKELEYISVDVKCERSVSGTEDEGRSLSPSPSASAESGSSNVEEEDSLHKLTSLVDRTMLELPSADSSVDSGSSCSDTSFSAPSPVGDDSESPRSAFVPARMSHSYPFAGVNPYPVNHFDTPGGLLRQEILARQEHAAFDHFAAQHGQIALEEAARLLQHHEAIVKQNKKLRPKKFRCPHCDVAFSNNGQLKGHIRIHTGALKTLFLFFAGDLERSSVN